MFTNKDKASVSLPKAKKVCGYEIKKQPIGTYLQTLEILTTMPADFMATCFPNKEPGEILEQLTTIDKNGLMELITGVCVAAPKYIIEIVAELTSIDKETIINDENIGIDGLLEIIEAFIEVNNLGKSLQSAVALKMKISGLTK